MKLSPPTLLQQVRILDPIRRIDQVSDVLLIEGELLAIDPQDIPAEITYIKAENLLLAPALVDIYSTLSEPGYEERETLSSLLKAAKAGGIGCLNLLTQTSLDNPAPFSLLSQRLQEEDVQLKVNFWGSVTRGGEGKQMTDLLELGLAGVVGFTDNSLPLRPLALVRRVLEYLKPLGRTLALTALDPGLQGHGVMREGIESIRLGLSGIPVYAETAPLAALLQLVEEISTPVHFMRISTAQGVQLIAQAKARGLPVTASTTWMHLLLSSADIASYDTNLRLEPPLGNPSDRTALIEGVSSGIIDTIAIDHSPYTYEEKTVSFAEAPSGAIGLEIALSLLWQELVCSGQLSALALWQAMTINPLEALGLPLKLSNWILFDPNYRWKVKEASLHSLSFNTPWLGQEISGKVVETFYNAPLR